MFLSAALMLQGCGFQPVYGNREGRLDTVDLLSSVDIQTPSDKYGNLFKAKLEDLFNPEARQLNKRYRLDAKLNIASEPFIIESDGTASRFTVRFNSPYTLVRIADNKVLNKGTVKAQSSYNVSEQDDYATVISQNDALKRGVAELAEGYKLRLGALFGKATQ